MILYMEEMNMQKLIAFLGIFVLVNGCGDVSGVIEPIDLQSEDEIGSAHRLNMNDFNIGIQVGFPDTKVTSSVMFTDDLSDGESWSPRTGLINHSGAVESARVWLSNDILTSGKRQIYNRDFRIVIVPYGHNNHCKSGYTEWATKGGGLSGIDKDCNDGSYSYAIVLKTRSLPASDRDYAYDVKLHIKGYNYVTDSFTVWATPTPWLSELDPVKEETKPSGWTEQIKNGELGGVVVFMEVRDIIEDFCSPTRKCEDGFGDCDTDADCKYGLRCFHDVGDLVGYKDPKMDICASERPEPKPPVVCNGVTCSPQEVCCQSVHGPFCGTPSDCDGL